MFPIIKSSRFPSPVQISLSPQIGEMVENFISEMEMVITTRKARSRLLDIIGPYATNVCRKSVR